MIRLATDMDWSAVYTLFNVCFPDESGFNEYYFQHCYQPQNTILLETAGKICAMTQMLPYQMQVKGETQEVTYIYGACTAEDERKKGYMARLLEYSFAQDREQGRAASILIPQEEWLFAFYAKFGYRPMFFINTTTVQPALQTYRGSPIVCRVGVEDIPSLRALYTDVAGKFEGYVERTEEQWAQQYDLFQTLGGEMLGLFEDGHLLAYASVWHGDEPWAQELLARDETARGLLIDAICSQFGYCNLKVSVPGGIMPFGVAKFHQDVPYTTGYMNLMFN